jgi:protein-L-isoaspartate(D-aspartate) O-methyltransferase
MMRTQAEATAEFLLRLRAQGIRNLDLLRALEMVPRRNFAPHRYADLAGRDVALPIGCGQTMSEPSLIAHMIDALELTADHRLLEVGTGSGYCTAVLARLCAEVVSLERYRTLVFEAQTRFAAMAIERVRILWRDALAAEPTLGIFNRILVHGAFSELPPALIDRLASGGKVIYARPLPKMTEAAVERGGQRLILAQLEDDGCWNEKELGAARLTPLFPGLSREL